MTARTDIIGTGLPVYVTAPVSNEILPIEEQFPA